MVQAALPEAAPEAAHHHLHAATAEALEEAHRWPPGSGSRSTSSLCARSSAGHDDRCLRDASISTARPETLATDEEQAPRRALTSRPLRWGSSNLSRAPSSPLSCSAATLCRSRVAGGGGRGVPPAARRARRGLTDALECQERMDWFRRLRSGPDRRRACERPSAGRAVSVCLDEQQQRPVRFAALVLAGCELGYDPLSAISAVLDRRIAACRLELGTTTTGIVVGWIRDGAKPQ